MKNLARQIMDDHPDDITRVDNKIVADIVELGLDRGEIEILISAGYMASICGMLKLAYYMGYRHFFDG